jgi:methionyl-tRNA formyltransferase
VKKIIFAGTPEIAAGVLDGLVSANYQISACLTQPDRPHGRGLKMTYSAVKTCALQHNIQVLQPKGLKKPAIQQQLIALQPDLMIVMAYGLILPAEVLAIPKLGCINIHASILPRWRGAAPIQYSILSGDKESGITIMQMDVGLDTGDILATYTCPIYATDTSADLHDRLAQLAKQSCITFLAKLQNGQVQPRSQDESLASYAHKIEKQQARINWARSAIEINRSIRAYNPWPVAFTNFMEEPVRIWCAEIVKDATLKDNTKSGTILAIDKQGLQVATGDGILRVLTMQFPGKKMLPVTAICNSNHNLVPGAVFI